VNTGEFLSLRIAVVQWGHPYYYSFQKKEKKKVIGKEKKL
jgi:hypothetical protein